MFDALIKLNTVSVSADTYGDETETTVEKEVFAKVKSVGMREKYTALELGLNPEIVFVLSDYLDYDNEKVLEYDGVSYEVIRTFRSGKELEIVCQRTGVLGSPTITPATQAYTNADLVFYVSGLLSIYEGTALVSSTNYTYKYQKLTLDSTYLASVAPTTLTAVTEFGNVNFGITV